MEAKVLYEASFTFRFSWLIFLGMLILVPWVTVKQIRKLKSSRCYRTRKAKIGAAAGVIATLWLLLAAALAIPDQIRMYQATVGAYHRGEYQIAEGYVEKFHPMPWSGHDTERFTVDGVEFKYSDYMGQFGYHNARSLGGVITGNGQHLRIGYTQYRRLGNVIVYIEELPDDPQLSRSEEPEHAAYSGVITARPGQGRGAARHVREG